MGQNNNFPTGQNNTLKTIQQNITPSGSSRPNIGASGTSLSQNAWLIPNKDWSRGNKSPLSPLNASAYKTPLSRKNIGASGQSVPKNRWLMSTRSATVPVPNRDMLDSNSMFTETLQGTKPMIITSGDCSDFDGFLALPIYYKAALETGADVYFMMTYPSYLNPKNNKDQSKSSNPPEPGLGYDYGFDVLKNHWSDYNYDAESEDKRIARVSYVDDVKKVIINYLDLNDWKDLNFKYYKIGMDKIAMDIITIIWHRCSEIFPNRNVPKIYWIGGGYNTINPFHFSKIKNEVYVYGKPLLTIKKSVTITNYCIQLTRDGFISHCNSCSQVFMDMNGSMAWYDTDIEQILTNKLNCCVVMGGVEPETSIDTISSVPDVINRFSTATMNQLYHPTNTGAFFEKFADKCIFVTNNAINKYFNWGMKNHKGRTQWLTKLLTDKNINNIEINIDNYFNNYDNFKTDINQMLNVMIDNDSKFFGTYSETLFDAFYSVDLRKDDRKPFDMISAYELYKCMMNTPSEYTKNKTLYFNYTYGITILSQTQIENLYEESGNAYNHLTKPFPGLPENMKGEMVKEYNATYKLILKRNFLVKYNVQIPKDISFEQLSSGIYFHRHQVSKNSYPQQEGGNQRRKKKSPVKYTKTGETYTDSKGVSRVLYEKKSSKGIMNSYVKMKNPTTRKFQYKKIS